MKARLADLGGTPLPGSPADFGKLIADETEKWGKVVSSPASSRSDRQPPAAHHLTNSRIARSKPSSVSGYIRPPMRLRIMRIDWVCSQSGSATGLSQTADL